MHRGVMPIGVCVGVYARTSAAPGRNPARSKAGTRNADGTHSASTAPSTAAASSEGMSSDSAMLRDWCVCVRARVFCVHKCVNVFNRVYVWRVYMCVCDWKAAWTGYQYFDLRSEQGFAAAFEGDACSKCSTAVDSFPGHCANVHSGSHPVWAVRGLPHDATSGTATPAATVSYVCGGAT